MEIKGNVVDVIANKIEPAIVSIAKGKIAEIKKTKEKYDNYILPPFVDSHIHIESSMVMPSEFAKIAATHGTVAVVADPHEIANVLGIEGVRHFINNSKSIPFKFYFGVPSCVPATNFETSGAKIDANDVKKLFEEDKLHFLSEMMNFPGVIHNVPTVMEKIEIAKSKKKVIDGHCPKLSGKNLKKYIESGISTDHECTTLDEAIEKINLGMKIQIRNGSSAKDFENLFSLIDVFPASVMLSSDDLKPENLLEGHINLLVKNAVKKGMNLMNVLRAASLNPIEHYNLNVGMLRRGDDADFIIIDNLRDFNVLQTFCCGKLIAENGKTKIKAEKSEIINNFSATPISPKMLTVLDQNDGYSRDKLACNDDVLVNVIGVTNGQIVTKKLECRLQIKNGDILPDVENDVLKLIVLNRYAKNQKPAVAFVKGFGLKDTAIATSISHDSHNIVAVGTDDEKICKAVNEIIKNKGGISLATPQNIEILELPIAGIISDDSIKNVAKKHTKIEKYVRELGSQLDSPFMTLSFLALLVIPELKLSDKGLFNSNEFRFEELIIQV